MPKPEWGVKRTCLSCASRFYDLGANPIICPKCGAEFDLAALVSASRGKAKKPTKAKVAAAKAAEAEDLVDDEDDVTAGTDADDAVDADADADDAVLADDDADDEDLGELGEDILLEDDDADEDEIEDLGDVKPEPKDET